MNFSAKSLANGKSPGPDTTTDALSPRLYLAATDGRYGSLVVRERKENETNQYDTDSHKAYKRADEPRGAPLLTFGRVSDPKEVDKHAG
jgi:hypothetical protein